MPGAWFSQQKQNPQPPVWERVGAVGTVRCYPPLAESVPRARVAVVVSKKVARKAVDRNRIRRRIYTAVRGYIAQLPPGVYLVLANRTAATRSFPELTRSLAQVMREGASN